MVTDGLLQSVREIVDVYIADNGVRYFRISWNDTWEPELHLISCEDLLEKFWQEKGDSNKVKCKQEKTDPSAKVEDISETTATISFCNCGKPANTNFKKKTFDEKSTQHSDSRKKSELGIQVNTYNRKNRNISVQVGSGIVTKSELGIQVNTYHRKHKSVLVQAGSGIVTKSELGIQVNTYHRKHKSVLVQAGSGIITKSELGIQVNTYHRKHKSVLVQAGSGIITKSELGIQVNTYHRKKRSISVQFTPKTVECGTQHETTYKNQCSQFENILEKEVSTQFTPEAEDCAIQNVAIYQDQYSQYENSFSDGDEGIFQKEVSVQFCPQTIDCGIQNTVYLQDQLTQCSENIFQKEVACQYTPKTISCGIQKDVMHLDKYCQYEGDFVLSSDNESVITSSKVDTHVCSDTTSFTETSLIGTQLYNQPSSCDDSTQEDTQAYAEDISHNKNIHTNIASQSCTQVYDGSTGTQQTFQGGTQKYGELIEDQSLDFNTTVEQTSEEKGDGKMKEMIFMADVPFGVQQNNVNDESHQNKNIDTASTSVIPDESNALNPPICILLTTGEDAILDLQGTTATTTALTSDLLFQSAQGCLSDENILRSQPSANILLPKNIMFQPNTSCLEDQTILGSEKHNATLTQHFIYPSQNEYSSGQATIYSAPQLTTTRTLPKLAPAVTMQLLNESIASLEQELTSLRQPTVYAGRKPSKQASGKKRQKSSQSSITDNCLLVSDATPIMCHSFESPDTSKKGKRKRVSDTNKSLNNSGGKSQGRGRKKKNVILEDQSNSDMTSLISKQTLNQMSCLPVYEIIPCTNPAKDEHINVTTAIVNEGINTLNFDITGNVNTEISKYGNTSHTETSKTLSSDGNTINDDFISKYWN